LEGKLLIAAYGAASADLDSILFGYDSGYISGVLAMDAFKQQFGGE
jgi:tape measure domain-containing protein